MAGPEESILEETIIEELEGIIETELAQEIEEESVETVMMITKGSGQGYVCTKNLEQQIEGNGGTFSMDFYDDPIEKKPTKLEFRFLNGVPKRKIIMNFTKGCPQETAFISDEIKEHNGDFVMTFSLNSPPGVQLNKIDFKFED